jgi:radical SAM enzyme (TIGR01210 family)
MQSVYPERGRDDWIIAQRPARNTLDPLKPHGFFLERELSPSGHVASSAVILLTNRECAWRCLMCDLWKNTLPYNVPPAAIPAQIDYALARLGSRAEQIKLYNSGSFFDTAAIPLEDYAQIAEKVSFADRVIVECHPKLVGEKTIAFRDQLTDPKLEVAMGLETIHPTILPRLNKQLTRPLFLRAARELHDLGIALRVFVLVKPPFMREPQAVDWAVKSTEFAFDCGAAVVSLIPTRPGNGAMDRLLENDEFARPALCTVENSLHECLIRFCNRRGSAAPGGGLRRRVFVDTWNLEQFATCPHCFDQRRLRLCQMNLTQEILPPIHCSVCKGVT